MTQYYRTYTINTFKSLYFYLFLVILLFEIHILNLLFFKPNGQNEINEPIHVVIIILGVCIIVQWGTLFFSFTSVKIKDDVMVIRRLNKEHVIQWKNITDIEEFWIRPGRTYFSYYNIYCGEQCYSLQALFDNMTELLDDIERKSNKKIKKRRLY